MSIAHAVLELGPTLEELQAEVAANDEPPRLRCPSCGRELLEHQWQSLPWVQFAGALRSGRQWVAVEVRQCVCTARIGREVVLPLLEVVR